MEEVYFNFDNGQATSKKKDKYKKAGLSFSNVCVCIGYDEHGAMFCRPMKTGKADALSIESCFYGRMDDVTLLIHDAESHRALIRNEKLKDKVMKSFPKTKESLRLMEPINDYSALLVNGMRKHPGTKAKDLGIRVLLSEMIKSKKQSIL